MDMAGQRAPARLRALPTWLLNQAAIPGNRLVTGILDGVGLRRHHYALLAALDEAGPASQADLGRRTTIDRSDMVAAVNDLAGHGFVVRRADPNDGRRNVVTITPAGRRQLTKLDRALGRAQDEVLRALSPKERAQLVGLLARVVDAHASGADQ